MLFSYSPDGFHDNWLHETLIEMLISDMSSIDDGTPRVDWPTCIPPPRRATLRRKYGLRDRRIAFLDCFEALGPSERLRVREAMKRQNAFPEIFSDGQACICSSELDPATQEAIKSLFEFGFGLLADLGLRDENYRRLYDKLKHKVCAFCGVELLDAPGQRREALDHYLPIAVYSFAGTNFRNLSPMGVKCNSRYKLQQDILIDPVTGGRRTCCDPYDSPSISLSLRDSRPFQGQRVNLVTCPDWVIQWEGGDTEKIQTWESVFSISQRYKESSLNPSFRDWIDHFCQWAARQPWSVNDTASLGAVLADFSEVIVPEGFADSAFLKRATFQMLASRCDDTEEGARLFEWLHGQIEERRSLAQ